MRNTNSKIFLLILLGSLTAFGPLVTDMYLPSLPSMTDYFGTQASMVQLGLTSSMIGLALGQLFFGPLSDCTADDLRYWSPCHCLLYRPYAVYSLPP